jgi:hypothetical protein
MHTHNRFSTQRQIPPIDENGVAQRYLTAYWTLCALQHQYERTNMQVRQAIPHYPCHLTGTELAEGWTLRFATTAARFENPWLPGHADPATGSIGTASRNIFYIDAANPVVTCGHAGFSAPITAPDCETTPTQARKSANAIATVGASRVQRLARIQAAFGFPIKVLAEILRRSRTQIYKWLDPQEAVDLQGESLQRLQLTARMAERWLTEGAAPLDSVAREPLPSGGTIVDLLSAPSLDDEAILAGFKYLGQLTKAKSLTLSQQLAARGFGRRKIALPDDD